MAYLTTTQCRALLDRDQAFKTSTGDVDSDLFLDFLNEIEDAYFDLAIQATPTEFLTFSTISTSSNPTTFATGYTIDVDGGGVFEVDADGNMSDTPLRMTNKGSPEEGYYIERLTNDGGFKVHFTPSSITTRNVVVAYVPYRTVLTDGATTKFSARKSHFVKRALLRQFMIWDENQQLNLQDSLFQNYLRDILEFQTPHRAAGVSFDLSSF